MFDACDKRNRPLIAYVVVSHLLVSSSTLLNANGLNSLTLTFSYIVTIITGLFALKSAGATKQSVKSFITCQ